eukprot:508079_1
MTLFRGTMKLSNGLHCQLRKSSYHRIFCTNISMGELMEARTQSDNELIVHVDENNNTLGYVTRKEMRVKDLFFRGSYILVFNSNNQLYVQKRTLTKDYCPGFLDNCAGGVVGKDETNDENAYRELYEELGIDLLKDNKKLKYHGCFLYKTVWENIYSCIYDGIIVPQPTEVESVHLKTIDEIQQEHRNGIKYCPDSMAALNHYIICRDLHHAQF